MSLRIKLAIISASSLLLVVLLLVAINVFDTGLIKSKSNNNTLKANLGLFKYLVNEHLVSMEPLADEIANEFDLRTAVKKSNKVDVETFAKRYIELTGGTGSYKTLELYDRNKQQLFVSDSSLTLKQADLYISQINKDTPFIADLGLLNSNEAVSVIAIPLKSRRKIIGYAIYSKDLSSIVNKLANTQQSQVFLVSSDLRVTHNSNSERSINLDSLLSNENSSLLEIIEADDALFEVTKQVVTNKQEEKLAYLLIARNETELLTQLRQYNLIAYAFTIVVVLLSFVFMSWMVKKSVINPLISIKGFLNKVANGDLASKIENDFKGEFKEMADDVEAVSSKLGNVVQKIQLEAESLANNTGMLNKTNEENIHVLEKQKLEAQNVATAMTQMTTTIQGVSDSARTAADQAQEADVMASNGEERVLEVIASIKQVSDEVESLKGTITQVAEHSKEIGSVVQIINGIAEQTNLLALNAAIEAARAGEQGRGFAVVSDEVRSLASKTQESTGQIREVIETLQVVTQKAVVDTDRSQARTYETVAIAEQAGESLQQINLFIEQISTANAQIANAVREQGQVSEEVNKNIVAISEMAETIHHGGIDTHQATNVLASMATNMKSLALQFQVDQATAQNLHTHSKSDLPDVEKADNIDLF